MTRPPKRWPLSLPRWDEDRRTPRPRRFVDGDRVIGGVSGDAHKRALDRGEQIEGGGRIITRRLGQRVDTHHAALIDAKMELPPATPAAATVFRGSPLTASDDGQTRAVEHDYWRPSPGGTGRRRRLRC